MVTKDLGMVTAYAYAVAGGYTGTEEEFTQLMASLADEVSRIENLSVTVTTLPAGSQATASLNGSVLSLGIPKGDKGDKGNTGNTPDFGIGTVTTLSAGSSATASITGTAENPVLNLGIPEGQAGSGAVGTVASAYSSSSTYAVGDYAIHNSNLYRCTTAINTAEAFTAAHWTQVVLGDDVSDLKSELTKLEAIASPIYEEIDITPDSQAINKYCYYNAQYGRIVLNNYNGASLFVYPISKGKTYRISGYGSDLESFPFAVVGDSDIVDSGASYANFIDVVEVGSSDRVYDGVDYYAQSDGYLYVNWYHKAVDDSATVKEITLVGYRAKKDGYGLYKSGNTYYYFHPDGDTNIIRLFTRRGINNLFQWNQILFGHFTNGRLEIDSSYNGFGTDIVGPISIWNGTLWPGQYGEWSGGNHGKTINGVEYATAEQIDFKCLVDGKEITEDGLYYGDVRFNTINKIYFPQSITGGDLSTATLSIIEHRFYHLKNSKMDVRVWHEYVEATRVALYYGVQMVYSAFDHIFCANNNYYKELNTIVSSVDLNAKERKIIFSKAENGLCLEMSLADVGLGTYQINDGSGGYATLLSYSIGKAYYDLIKNASNASITAGSNLLWEGTYDLYFG